MKHVSAFKKWMLLMVGLLLSQTTVWAEGTLTVAGVRVTADNANSIVGDQITIHEGGELYFDPQMNILTMKDVELTGPIVSSLDQLIINVIDYNKITVEDGPCIYYESVATTAPTGGSTGGTLTLSKGNAYHEADLKLETGWNSNNSVISGFSSLEFYEISVCEPEDGATYGLTNCQLTNVNGDLTRWCTISSLTYYKLKIGNGEDEEDVRVTSANQNDVLGDGHVSFNPNTNTLTLNNATINGGSCGITSWLDDLTIHLLGENTIYAPELFIMGWKDDGTQVPPTLTFTTDDANPGMLLAPDCWEYGMFIDGFEVVYENGLCFDLESDDEDETSIARIVKGYDLWIGDCHVTILNADALPCEMMTDDYGEFNFDPQANILKMHNVRLTAPIWSGLDELIINVIEENEIEVEDGPCLQAMVQDTGAGTLVLSKGNALHDGILHLKTNESSNSSVIYGFRTLTCNGMHVDTEGNEPVYDTGRHQLMNADGGLVTECTYTSAQVYDLWIGDLQVTSSNAAAIHEADQKFITLLDESGSVSFNSETSTLSLNNAQLKHGIISGLEHLTIQFSGTNKVNTDGQVNWQTTVEAAQYDAISTLDVALNHKDPTTQHEPNFDNPTLTFAKVGESSVQLCGNTMHWGGGAIAGFASVSFGSGDSQCYLQTSAPSKYDTNSRLFLNMEGGYANVNATITSAVCYPLWIGNGSCVQVTADNQDEITSNNITGDVSFVPASNKLKLKNASIYTKVYSGLGNLTIDLEGVNYILPGDTGCVVRSFNAGTLKIQKTGTKASLKLESDSFWDRESAILGFSALDYTGFNLIADTPVTYGEFVINEEDDDWEQRIMCLYNPEETEDYYMSVVPSVLFTTGTPYPLWVDGVRVTSDNADNVLNDDESTVSYDDNTKTLTLNNVHINAMEKEVDEPSIKTSMPSLTINLLGVNMLDVRGWGESAAISNTNDEAAGSLIFKTDPSNPGMLSSNAYSEQLISGFDVTFEDGLAESYELIDGEACMYSIAKGYNLWLGNQQVTEANRESLIWDYEDESKMASFDGRRTLTLQNVAIFGGDGYGIKSDLGALNVHLLGLNVIDAEGGSAFVSLTRSEQQPTVTFTTDDQDPGQLELKHHSYLFDGCDPVYRDGFVISMTWDEQQDKVYVISVQDIRYDIWFGETQITNKNHFDVFEDGTVTFTEPSTLVIRDLNLTDVPLISDLDSLSIVVLGDNVLKSTNSETPIYTNRTGMLPKLTFTTSPSNAGTLKLYDSAGNYITGFAEPWSYLCGLEGKQVDADDSDAAHFLICYVVPITPIVDESDEGAQEEPPTEDVSFTDDDFVDDGTSEVIDLSNTTINNVVYTLPKDDTVPDDAQGYYPGDGTDEDPAGIVLNVSLLTEDLEVADSYIPGSPEYAEKFKGITLMVPAGTGTIMVVAKTDPGAVLNVRIGNDEPYSITNVSITDTTYVDYACAEDTYVKIYMAGDEEPSRSYSARQKAIDLSRSIFRDKKESISVKVTGLSVSSSALVSTNAINSNGMTPVKVYQLSASNFVGGGIVIDKVCGNPVTEISSNLFSSVQDKSSVGYIDMSGSALKGVDLSSGAGSRQRRAPKTFAGGLLDGFEEGTLVFLPKGNSYNGMSNVVVDDVCDKLELKEGRALRIPHDFVAEEVAFDRSFVENQYATVFLPFSIPAARQAELGEFYTFRGIEGANALFNDKEEGDLAPNTPYIFKPASTSLAFTGLVSVKGLENDATGVNVGEMYGTYEKIVWADDQDDIYCFAASDEGEYVKAGEFVRMGAGSWVDPYRAYLKVDDANHPARYNVLIGEEQIATGISFNRTEETISQNVYDLQGRLIHHSDRHETPLRHGVYVTNGKKMVVK